MFNIFRKKKEAKITTVVPDKIPKVTVHNYDEKEALATFLKLNGISPSDIKEILDSKFPFDKAWKIYYMPRKHYYDEMLRQLNHLKLLVIERLKNNEQRGAFIVSCIEYFRLFAAKSIGISYPKCEKEDYYDLEGFIKKLNSNDFEWIKKELDKDVFNCIAFYSQKFNITFKDFLLEIEEQISHNPPFADYLYDCIGGTELFINIISKLLELSFVNMRYTLNSVVTVEKIEKINKNEEINNFFDFTNMRSIYEGIQKQFIIQDDNIKIAEKEIEKALKILDFLKNYKKIPESVNYNIKNIVYAVQYKKEIQLHTFLRYTPLTSTGKIAKNMCVLNFDINEESCEYLNEGLYTINNIMDGEKHKGLGGVIKYNKDRQITEIKMFFCKDNTFYNIKTKTSDIKKLDDIELTIDQFTTN